MTCQEKSEGKLEKIVKTSGALLVVGATLAASAAIVCVGRAYDEYKTLKGSYHPNFSYK